MKSVSLFLSFSLYFSDTSAIKRWLIQKGYIARKGDTLQRERESFIKENPDYLQETISTRYIDSQYIFHEVKLNLAKHEQKDVVV